MAEQAIHKAIEAVINVVGEADRYFAAQAPWGLKKTDPARMETVLWTTAELVRRIAILMAPYIPRSASKLLDLLAVAEDKRGFQESQKWGRQRSRQLDTNRHPAQPTSPRGPRTLGGRGP
jgi:methionyl-tRNA synthetase